MKKVMIGILILIPIIILFVVAMVSNIVSMQAWISVEDMQVVYKNTETKAETLTLSFDDVRSSQKTFFDYLAVKILPERANRYSINWQILDNIRYTDEDYEAAYLDYEAQYETFLNDFEESYRGFEEPNGNKHGRYVLEIEQIISGKPYKPIELENEADKLALKEEIKNDLKNLVLHIVKPAVVLIDNDGNEVDTNNSGKFIVYSYCAFTLRVEAEHVSRIISVTIAGEDVEKVVLVDNDNGANLVVGQSKRLNAKYTPIDSIVGYTQWSSDNTDVAIVDQNGIVTAVGVGEAHITMKASKHSSVRDGGEIEYVESAQYTVNTTAGAVAHFGNMLATAKTTITVSELGITEASAISGCVVSPEGVITLTDDHAVIDTPNGEFAICRVDEGSIKIENSSFYDENSGFVLAVETLTLKLKATWQDMLCNDAMSNVEWTSSDESIATVSDTGEVSAKSRGVVTISAICNGRVASVVINVQHKTAMLQLKTTDDSLAVGVARQTVFASERYVDITLDNSKEANSTYIIVQGQPEDASKEDLELFYSAYLFEIVSGGEYAAFDSVERNKLVFNSETLEKQRRQDIVVRVKAKYPKYDDEKLSQQNVTITAVYGVEVSNIAEFRDAALYQKDYAYREDNLIPVNQWFEHYVEAKGDTYYVADAETSLFNYAIVLSNNVAYEIDEEGNPVEFTWEGRVRLYGDIYGNNHMISTTGNQASGMGKMLQLCWGNTTFSNVILRAFNIGDDAVITDGSDTQGFDAECLLIENVSGMGSCYRLKNINFEYCIFENGEKFASIYNADITIKGCILRNMSQCAVWTAARMNPIYDGDDISLCHTYYARYGRVTIENIVVSNSLGTFASLNYDSFVKYLGHEKGGGFRFADTEEENKQYYLEHFASKGVNQSLHQYGFADIYNWVDVESADLLDTGTKKYNDYIRMFSGPMVKTNAAFDGYRIVEQGDNGVPKYWMHLGFVTCGTGGAGLVLEPVYADVVLQDKRFSVIYTKDLQVGEDDDSLSKMAVTVLGIMDIRLYLYRADNVDAHGNSILPHMRYFVDSALISRLHND